MGRVVGFRQSLIKTSYSSTLERFVRFYLVDEEVANEFLSDLDLGGLTKEEYASSVVQAYLADPSIYTDLDEDVADKLTWELYDLILDGNSYLDPDNLEQVEVPTPRKPRKRKPKLNIDKAVEVYRTVKRTLDSNIVGQREAVDKVVEAVGRGLLRSTTDSRPICSLLLYGESGVGKTELGRQLASALGTNSLIKVDCSEYSESHQMARLIGAPAGYIGYGVPTLLERRLDPNRLQVLLLDEFEKADRSLFNLLLSALEDGTITTAADTVLSLRNCVVLLTSNLGVRQLHQQPVGFLDQGERGSAMLAVIKRELPIELVNRLTALVFFHPLTASEQERVALLELEKLKRNVEHLVRLTWAEDAPKGVVGKVGIGKERNARSIRNYMDTIHANIAARILNGSLQPGSDYRATFGN